MSGDIVEKYKERIYEELYGEKDEKVVKEKKFSTQEYKDFRKEFLPKHLNFYEKACNLAETAMKLKPSEKDEAEIKEYLSICHLEVTPGGVIALSYLAPLLLILFGSLISYALFQRMFFVFYFLLVGALIGFLLRKTPQFLANNWRLKASNQMVQSIFYVVTYMRHTSNLENALAFATEHLSPPLSLDLKKVLWDVESSTYDSLKNSLDAYLETWRKWNVEFIEAFHLIESSLYEPSEDRRLSLVEKALDVMLTETYEKMLHFTHELKSPITALHMLGVILPILGLVILPMVTSFLTNDTTTPGIIVVYLALMYNITLPIVVYIFGRIILTKRPTGYGDTDISNEFPELKKFKNVIVKLGDKEIKINPIFIAVSVGLILFAIGIWPFAYKFFTPDSVLLAEKPIYGIFKLYGYVENLNHTKLLGPYGLGATLLSVLATAGLGLGAGIYYKLRSKNVIEIRDKTKQLENEFASGLFQLGNRIGDGIPTEIAFQNVSEIMVDTKSGEFFRLVANNISNLGMSVKDAIFNPKNGALVYFPSNLIKSSMKVLIESSRKGPQICSRTVLTVAEYIKEIHRVNERLKDLMAEIVSSMKQQISFMAPVISGVVIGITSMLVTILTILRQKISTLNTSTAVADSGMGLLSMFGDSVPAYFFQLIVGFYVVEIVFVLTVMVNGIENGSDKLSENYLKGINLVKSTTIYCIITFILIMLFNIITSSVLSNLKFS